jgi:hypothetical protein
MSGIPAPPKGVGRREDSPQKDEQQDDRRDRHEAGEQIGFGVIVLRVRRGEDRGVIGRWLRISVYPLLTHLLIGSHLPEMTVPSLLQKGPIVLLMGPISLSRTGCRRSTNGRLDVSQALS